MKHGNVSKHIGWAIACGSTEDIDGDDTVTEAVSCCAALCRAVRNAPGDEPGDVPRDAPRDGLQNTFGIPSASDLKRMRA